MLNLTNSTYKSSPTYHYTNLITAQIKFKLRIRIQVKHSGSEFRVRIQDLGSWSKSGSVFSVYLRVCFVVQGLIQSNICKNPISNFWGNPIASFRVGVKLISRTVFHSLKCYVRIIHVKQNQKQSQNRPKIIVELTLIEHPTCSV